jgi:DEAD/DEAH box helicase domain-containing protein
MSITRLVSHWKAEATIGPNIVASRTIPQRTSKYQDLPEGLHPRLSKALKHAGIQNIYTHQREVWDRVMAGENPVIVTGTASGKTLAYSLPILDTLVKQPFSRALFLFPTKALAQDQQNKLHDLLKSNSTFQIPIGIYDGDTPTNERASIRKNARIIISNPDMLHAGILPHHTLWLEFLQYLDFIVIDEIHTYRGVFGSHVANVLRRLKRIYRQYQSEPRFIMTSATIGNPLILAHRLIEEPVVLVDEDGSAVGPKHFLLYNPPIVNKELGIRRSSLLESVHLTEDLLAYNIQTIIFGQTRRTVELILTYLRERYLDNSSPALENNGEFSTEIRGYRSGYLPRQRREIEHGLRSGKVRLVVATNALELGIDIGRLGASVLTGYPGTIAATWQQAGRAGRLSDTSLTILITNSSPVDQFLAHHPDYLFDRNPESGLINPDNLLILVNHLKCAVFERPFVTGESFGNFEADLTEEILQFLSQGGEIHFSGGKYFWMSDQYPSQSVSLRSASTVRILLQTDKEGVRQTIGEVDIESATWMVHPQAVYLHEAESYLVDELDLDENIALLKPVSVDYYTQPTMETTIEAERSIEQEQVQGGIKAFGDIVVTSRVTGFKKIKWTTRERFDHTLLDLPPSILNTTGYWIAISDEILETLRNQNQWKADPNRYGQSWTKQKDLTRARDQYRCQMCGAPEIERAHHVHHKIPYRTFQDSEIANQLDNLITLCPVCHKKAEDVVRIRSGLAGLAYSLGNLAPLFLMCDSRDLGISSDPNSALSGGKATIILYDKVPAGIGFSEKLFEIHNELIHSTYDLVSKCECDDGCPSCVGPGGESGMGGKIETLAILAELKPVG